MIFFSHFLLIRKFNSNLTTMYFSFLVSEETRALRSIDVEYSFFINASNVWHWGSRCRCFMKRFFFTTLYCRTLKKQYHDFSNTNITAKAFRVSPCKKNRKNENCFQISFMQQKLENWNIQNQLGKHIFRYKTLSYTTTVYQCSN